MTSGIDTRSRPFSKIRTLNHVSLNKFITVLKIVYLDWHWSFFRCHQQNPCSEWSSVPWGGQKHLCFTDILWFQSQPNGSHLFFSHNLSKSYRTNYLFFFFFLANFLVSSGKLNPIKMRNYLFIYLFSLKKFPLCCLAHICYGFSLFCQRSV